MKETLIDNVDDSLILDKNNISELKEEDEDEDYKEEYEGLIDKNIQKEKDEINKQKQEKKLKILYYYEIWISIFLLLNSFIYFSFINILHIFYSYYIIYNMFSTKYNIRILLKKYFTLAIIILDGIYLIMKGAIHLYINSKKEKVSYDNNILKIMNIYEDNWRTIYEYIMTSISIIFLVINMIFRGYSQVYFNDNELKRNIDFIEKYIKNCSEILLIGVLILSFGSSFCPSIINLIILIIAFFYLTSRLFNKKFYRICKIYFKYFFLCVIVLSTLYNYTLSNQIIEKYLLEIYNTSKIPYGFGIVSLYEYDKDDFSYNASTFFNLIFFYISFFFINLHIKIKKYMKENQQNIISFKTLPSISENDFPSLKEDDEKDEFDENKIKENNLKNISLSGTFYGDKEQIEMQSLFNFDMDCGIVLFLRKSKNENFLKIIKSFLLNFCYSPGFSLHACRLGFIFWINFFQVYYESYLIIIWILVSIKYSETKIFFYFTKFIIYPFFLIIYFNYYIVNLLDKKVYSLFSLNIETEPNPAKRVIKTLIRITIIFLIQMFVHLNANQLKNLEDKDIKNIIKKHQNRLEKSIDKEFKGKYVVKPIEIFFKLYFILIDIFIIVFFYLSFSQKINLFNEAVLVSVIFFLIKGESFKRYLYTFLMILSLSFLYKYTIYIFNLNKFNTLKTINNIIINDDLYKVYYYWISYYLLFLEYIAQNSKLFKLCETKNFSIKKIIEYNFSSYIYIKFILNTLFNFIFGVYIWLLIPCFIYCLLFFDNNFLSLFQLTIVFVIYYKYIRIVNTKFKSIQKIYKYTRILIFTNIIYLIIEYISQFLNDSDFLVMIYLSHPNQKFIKIMELIGFFLFKVNYQNNLLSSFMMFILSLALHIEIHRQQEINRKDSSINQDAEKYSIVNAIHKFSLMRTSSDFSDISVSSKSSEQSKESEQKGQETIKKLEKTILENQKMKNIVQKIFNLLYYILHYYWIIIFIFEVVLSIHWMLSLSMIMQLSTFSYYMAKSFKEYYKCLKSQTIENESGIKKYNTLTLNQLLKLYKNEKKQHFKITSKIQHSYFSLIWIFTFSFIVLSYLTSIILKSLSLSENNENIKNYISAITYFLGVYSESKTDINSYSFWSYTWGYFITIGLFSIRAYLMSKFAELKLMYFSDESKKEKNKYNNELGGRNHLRQSRILEIESLEQINKMGEINLNDSMDMSIYEKINKSVLDEDNNDKNFEKEREENCQNKINENMIIKKEDSLMDKLNKRFIGNYFKSERIFYSNNHFGVQKYYEDINIRYKKNIINKNFQTDISFQMALKKFIEIVIIILLLLNAVSKCNILSFVFLLIIIPAYKLKFVNTFLMFRISFINLFLLLLQYIFFISNISYATNPFINKDIILNINNIFRLPWYKDYRWSTFFSFGTNRYQIISIWLDVIIILILYFYLEFFSYTIFIEKNKTLDLKIISQKYHHKFSRLKTISNEEYKLFIRAMKVSYNIELIPSDGPKNDKKMAQYTYKKYNKTILRLLYLFKGDKSFFKIKKNSKRIVLNKIRQFLYISFQYLFLLMILLISSFNQGIIAFGYMAFSIYYIYKSNTFLKGARWTLLSGIKYFLKPYVYFDILTHFILQIPLDKFKKNEEVVVKFFKLFGYEKIADYSSQKEFISAISCFIVILKILCFFMLLIQESMFNSFEFKKFILKYHYEYMQKAYIKGKLHSFLFNNQRVRLMNDRDNENKKVQKNLLSIEKAVNSWNNKLKSYNNDELSKGDSIYQIAKEQIITNKKEKGITISKILRKHWLISIILKVFAASNHIDDEYYNKAGYILKILKGNYALYPYLDSLINEYEEKNFEKYNDTKKVKKLLTEYFMKKNKLSDKKESENIYKDINELDNKRHYSVNIQKNNILVKGERRISNQIEKERWDLFESLLKISKENNINNENKRIEKSDNSDSIDNSESSEDSKDVNNFEKRKNLYIDNNKYIKLGQQFDDTFFANSDYRDLKNLIREEFFNEYLSRKKLLLIFLKTIGNFLIEHNEYIIYFFITLYHILNGKALSIIYPILVFTFGIIQYPRPNKFFWKLLMIYTTFIIFLKFFIQSNLWELGELSSKIYIYFDESSEDYISYLGLKKIPDHDFYLFMSYIFPDFFILLLLIINQIILIRKGLWYNSESGYENIEEANNRIIIYNSEKMLKRIKFDENCTKMLSPNEIIKLIGKAKSGKQLNIVEKIKKFNKKIFNKFRNEKPGRDFYNYYTFTMIIILIYIIFFYTNMEQDSIIYNASVFKVKQFSENMVIFAFIHVFIISFDRFLYLRNKGKLKKIIFKVYNKKTGEDITYKFGKYKYDDVLKYVNVKNKTDEEENNLYISAFQFEETNFGLIIKYLTQVILVIFIHLFIYAYLPSKVRTYKKSDDDSEEKEEKVITTTDTSKNAFLIIFYILYIVYLLFSGLQIKYGYTDLKNISMRMRASNIFASITYQIYIQIPFLFELKNFIDWTFTSTALNLWQWLKLEEIISLLYINKCYSKSILSRRIGSIIPNYKKILFGGLTNFIIIILIFGPLILFSSLNPINSVNKVDGVNLKIVLCMEMEHNAKINLTLFQTYNSIIQSFENEVDYSNYLFKQRNSELNNFNKSYKYNQVQKVRLIAFSEHRWDISNQFKIYFDPNTNYSNNEYYLSLIYSFSTTKNNEISNYRYENKFIIDENIMSNLSHIINSNESNRANLFLKNFYYPYQRITEDNTPNPLVYSTKKNVTLSLEKTKIKKDSNDAGILFNYNWYLKEGNETNKKDDIDDIEGIEFLTFTDLFSDVIFGYDVITFYITFIFVSGKIIRAIFLGRAEDVIYTEMVNQNKLFSVCEGIKISRLKKNFLQEGKLYFLLIDMMRSPEIIKNMTKSSLLYAQEGNIVREEIKSKEVEIKSEPIIRKTRKLSKIEK